METQETQLLKDYSENEKAAYLGAIASVASADRVASPAETEFLTLLSQSAGLSAEGQQEVLAAAQDPSNLSIRQCLDILKNSDLRFSFITDVMAFAKADGKLDAQEQSKIQEMAQYLNINQQQFGALQQFVTKAEEAQQHGEDPTDASFLQRTGLANSLGQAGVPTGGMMKGLIGILAPILISKVLSGRQGQGGMGTTSGGTGSGMGGGLLGGLLGSVMGGGMGNMGGSTGNMGGLGGLGGLLGGGQTAQHTGQGRSGGGLGSLMSVLGGLGGQQGYNSGGLGSILGSVLGGGRR